MDTLTFTPPIKISEFSINSFENNKRHGIYIIGFMDNTAKFKPYYIGKANNIYTRIFTHVGHIKGGLFTIHKLDDIVKDSFNAEQPAYYTPKDIADFLVTFTDEVQAEANKLIKNLYITFAITNDIEKNAEWEKASALYLKKLNSNIASIKGELLNPDMEMQIRFL